MAAFFKSVKKSPRVGIEISCPSVFFAHLFHRLATSLPLVVLLGPCYPSSAASSGFANQRKSVSRGLAAIPISRYVGIATRGTMTEVDTGARDIDHILTRTLPEMSAEFLGRMAEGKTIREVRITVA